MEILFQTAGWIGTFCVVFAYFLLSTDRVSGTSRSYEFLNLFGAIGVGINVFHQHAWPAVALQAIWFLIAIFSLFRIQKHRHVFPHHPQKHSKR